LAILTAILSPIDEDLARYRMVLEALAKRILPAGQLADDAILLSQSGPVLIAVHGRRDGVIHGDTGVLAGLTRSARLPGDENWLSVGGPIPDGSFALMRSDGKVLEAISDFAGSKSLWQARLKCGGVAVSTCFEAILALLGDLSLDEKTLGWFLSSGSTGPKRSWDKRVKPVPRNSVLRAGIRPDDVARSVSRVQREKEVLPTYDASSLREEIDGVLSSYPLADSPWLIALSGGFDSRAILYGTRQFEDITCITWIDETSDNGPDSDLAIARQLAAKAGRAHEVKAIERPGSAEQIESSLRRFARYSDGRNDNVLAYLDGMAVWDEIGAGAAAGLLRGDELFGSSIALSAHRIRHNMRLNTFEDYADSREQRELAGRHPHKCPSDLLRRDGETVSHWRLRLRAEHEIPVIYAALNAVRSRFIESCCPLLDRRLVGAAASIASHHLDERSMYTRAVGSMYPDVPIAKARSTLDLKTFLTFPAVAELLMEHLSTDFARDSLGARVAKSSQDLAGDLESFSVRSTAAKGNLLGRYVAMPLWAKRLKRRMDSPVRLNVIEVAFRSLLASLIIAEMEESVRLGNEACNSQDLAIA